MNKNKAIQQIKEIKMTNVEKAGILERILSSSALPKKPIASPFRFYSFYFSMSCLVLILGSGAVLASGKSLPGDILYPLKVKVAEPIQDAFLPSPLDKAQYSNVLEAERPAKLILDAKRNNLDVTKSKLSPTKQKILEDTTKTLNKATEIIQDKKQPKEEISKKEKRDLLKPALKPVPKRASGLHL